MPRGKHVSKRLSGFKQRKKKQQQIELEKSIAGSMLQYVRNVEDGQGSSQKNVEENDDISQLSVDENQGTSQQNEAEGQYLSQPLYDESDAIETFDSETK